MKTQENLSTAFAGESQANRKYLCFAEQAEKEGYKNAARLFRAAAEAEQIHAFAEFREKGGVGNTAENLKAAKEGETYEFTEMYPPFIETAQAEGHHGAAKIFNFACQAEKVHAELYEDAIRNLERDEGDLNYYLCPICGFIHKGNAPTVPCPICGSKPSIFKEF